MRVAVYAILASMTLLGVGCHHNTCRNGCTDCCENRGHSHQGQMAYSQFDEGHGGHGRFGREHRDPGHSGHGHLANSRSPSRVARLPHGYMQQQMYGQGGPPSPTVAYPYYTTRAPRDFLMANPPSIGP